MKIYQGVTKSQHMPHAHTGGIGVPGIIGIFEGLMLRTVGASGTVMFMMRMPRNVEVLIELAEVSTTMRLEYTAYWRNKEGGRKEPGTDVVCEDGARKAVGACTSASMKKNEEGSTEGHGSTLRSNVTVKRLILTHLVKHGV
jgi:hypothetical protein